MTPERWQRVNEIFHAALKQEPAQRSRFVFDACAGDDELRREVESLIAADEKEGSFLLDHPTSQFSWESLAGKSGLKAGENLASYEIISLLGEGGMGEVYLGQDQRLGRRVALKLLPALSNYDLDRLRRFEREARAASALNHPNILTIHEIGQDAGRRFIATEYVDGETLRQRLRAGPLAIQEALQISEQVASALTAAHGEGIIHRDIKPENIMVRRDGIVKVLDFGLAKLVEDGVAKPDDPTRALIKTDAGVVMGTAQYMSPEQARGLPVDGRTDIFSIGVVLYEMIAGDAPFKGDTASDVIASILKTEPPLLSRRVPELPAELQRIVTKTLEKDREERYQTVKDLLLDLRRLKQRLAYEAEQRRSTDSHAGKTVSTPAAHQLTSQPADPTITKEATPHAAPTVSSAEYLVTEIKRHKRGVILAFSLFLLVSAAGVFFLYRWISRATTTFPSLKIARLTSTGKATHAAISPDGKYVVYAVDDAGQQSLWLSQVSISSQVQIVPPADVQYVGLTFARDGSLIYYVRNEGDNRGILYQAPTLGGNPRKLLIEVHSAITLSTDGKQFAFVRQYPANPGGDALIIANADGSNARTLYQLPKPNLFGASVPAWSPDDKTIAVGLQNYVTRFYSSVLGIRVADGSTFPINAHRWEGMDIGRLAWLADRALLVTVTGQLGNPPQIWYVSSQTEEARQIVNDLNSYGDVSLAPDSGILAAVRTQRSVNLWISPAGDVSRAKQLTSGSEREDGVGGLDWTPDNQIVYRSAATGGGNLWIIAPDGTGNRQLTVRGHDAQPLVTSDGRYILWISRPVGADVTQLWRMDMDGGNRRQLTGERGAGVWFPSLSADGKWVLYGTVGGESPRHAIWKTSIDGGDPIKLTNSPSWVPAVSPDGKTIACNWLDETSGRWKLAILPFEGGTPTKIFEVVGPYARQLRWVPDGSGIAYVQTSKGVSNIWAQPIDGSPPKQLTDFKDQRIGNFRWSRDGKQLALARGVVSSDVVLISGLK